jgi:ArsR family transcriptional regulator
MKTEATKTKAIQTADLTFRAVADPTRLRLLNLLRGGERCVCELVDSLRIPQPKASRHLAYLRRAGLVSVREDGRWAYYALTPARNQFHAKLLECLESCFTEVPIMKRDSRRMQQTGKCC